MPVSYPKFLFVWHSHDLSCLSNLQFAEEAFLMGDSKGDNIRESKCENITERKFEIKKEGANGGREICARKKSDEKFDCGTGFYSSVEITRTNNHKTITVWMYSREESPRNC